MKRVLLLAALCACGPKHTGAGASTDEVDWAKSGIDWDHVPGPGPEPTFTLPSPIRFTLDNGIDVVLVENHRLPLVSVRAVCADAGARGDGQQLGLASLAADLILEGAGDRDARALPEAVEELGASLDTGISEDAATVWLDTLASTLEDSLALLADVVVDPQMTEADFERVRGDALEDLRQRPQEPRRVANLVFDRHVLADHPYGQPTSGFVATIKALTWKDVRTFWSAHTTFDSITLVVAGDVDRDTLEPMLARTLGRFPAPPMGNAVKVPGLHGEPKPALIVVDRPGAAQSVVMIGTRGRRADDAQYYAAEVINTAAGGSFASRLNTRLREELGYTYGMYSQFWRGEWAGTWAVTSSIKTDVTVQGIDEALKILADLRTTELPAEELAKTKSFLIKQRPQSFETNAGIAGEYASLIVDRLPLAWLDGYDDGVRAVTAADARALAAEAWDGLSIVVVGDWSKIGDGLAGLGLPIEHVDAEGVPVRD